MKERRNQPHTSERVSNQQSQNSIRWMERQGQGFDLSNRKQPFSCHIPGCSFKSKNRNYLSWHVRVVHSNERPYQCDLEGCSYKAKSRSSLRERSDITSSQRMTNADKVGGWSRNRQNFDDVISERSLRDHLKVHSEERPFLCTFTGCNKTFKKNKTLKLHTNTVHSEEKPFKCSTCEFATKRKSYLHQHENEHKNIKRFRCPAPNCTFANYTKFKVQCHFDAKHGKKNILYTKPGCTYKCGSVFLLKKHQWIHMLPILKCPKKSCNSSARNPGDLRRHVARFHADVQSDSLMLPIRSRRKNAEQAAILGPLICPFPKCHYQTEFPHRYENHKKFHDEGKRKLTCKFCHLKFKNNYYLEAHIQRHTGEKPYSCSYCDFTTANPSPLKIHGGNKHGIYVISHGEETKDGKICKLCKKICTSNTEFVLHSMKHLQAVVVLDRLRLKRL